MEAHDDIRYSRKFSGLSIFVLGHSVSVPSKEVLTGLTMPIDWKSHV